MELSKVLVFLGLFLCLNITSTLDSTQADSVVGVQYINSSEVKSLLKDQKLDLKVFLHLQKSEMSGFKASQEIQLKEWENHEKKERHKFFMEHAAGTERRAYIQDFMKRRDDLIKQIAADKAQKIKEQSAKLKAFRDDQDAQVRKVVERMKSEQESKVKTVSSPGTLVKPHSF